MPQQIRARIVTIERHILNQQRLHPEASGVFSDLLYDIALAAKLIARETTRAGLADILGMAGGSNVQGEEQKKLDVFANRTLIAMNDHTGRLCAMASEEVEDIIPIPDQYECGKYVLLFDPLDGSSNIEMNVSIGTIFSIHRKISPGDGHGTLDDCLQPGHKQVAAGYVLFGSSTMLVYTTGQGVHGFTLDPGVGEFLLSHKDLSFPAKPKYYSVNQGYEKYWHEGVRRYVKWLQGLDDSGQKGLSSRYIGSLVADFHRNLLTGGVFLYPPDTRDPAMPYGKLRLLYEASPLAFIAEQAGGAASDGVNRILDIQPTGLHQRLPLFAGNRELVEKANEFVRTYDTDWVDAYMAER
jgi:fructose-1,6-bisphosphatase I